MSMPKHLLNTKRRVFLGGAVKSIDSEKRTIRAYASTNGWDRYEERFEPDAFAGDGMKNYLKNPVVLFAHDYSQAPIAKAIAHEFDEKGLILTMQFADTEKAQEIFALYEGGFMNAFSVGFRPIEVAYEERTKGGRMGVVYKRAELLENSAVPVPANPEAVVIKGLGDKTMQVSGDAMRAFMSAGYEAREPMELPEKAAPEASGPDMATTLEYLLGLAKMIRAKGKKVEGEELRGLLIQSVNLFRELIYGPGSPKVENDGAPLSPEAKAALVAEYEAMVEALSADATDEDKQELAKVGEMIEREISRE